MNMHISTLLTLTKGITSTQHRCISITLLRPFIQKWREERGLPLNPNAYGILTDKPDYTYLDGRPTPLGMRQRDRVLKHRELTNKIIELSREVDFAVDRHKRMNEEKENERQLKLNSKLKPKGDFLLKK